jgi:hypothetical protein
MAVLRSSFPEQFNSRAPIPNSGPTCSGKRLVQSYSTRIEIGISQAELIQDLQMAKDLKKCPKIKKAESKKKALQKAKQLRALDYVLAFCFRFRTNAANSVAIMKSVRMTYEGNSGTTGEAVTAAVLDVA